MLRSLCRFTSVEKFDIITPIVDDKDMDMIACYIKYIGPNKSVNTLGISLTDNRDSYLENKERINKNTGESSIKEKDVLSPLEYIYSNKFYSKLNPKVRKEILEMLIVYIDIIATSTDELTPSKLNPHHIELIKNAKPFKSKFYKLYKIKSDILKEELIKLINQGLIEHSRSSWSSPIVLVLKKNGKWRLCSDYRKLNAMTVPDSYSLPNIDEIFDSLGGATIFSTLDLFSGYHQIKMDEDSIDLTCFTTKFGNFVYKVMPFGLTGAPATFQREMNRILFDLLGKCVFVFIDILIFSKLKEDHLKHLNMVFEIFRKYEIKINIEKCSFFQEEVEVLGHIVTNCNKS